MKEREKEKKELRSSLTFGAFSERQIDDDHHHDTTTTRVE